VIVLEIDQKSQEWIECRRGIPTASSFDLIVTSKGEPSKQREKYLYRLAGERVSGQAAANGYKNASMERGEEMEQEARAAYEFMHDCQVVQVGICYPNEDRKYACSPDGLVGDDGILEIKCPDLATHVAYLLKGTLPTEYVQQVQGQLLVTGRQWCDFMSYYPGLKPLIVRVYPDTAFQDALAKELEQFNKDLEVIAERIAV